jgi:hypothetical protein
MLIIFPSSYFVVPMVLILQDVSPKRIGGTLYGTCGIDGTMIGVGIQKDAGGPFLGFNIFDQDPRKVLFVVSFTSIYGAVAFDIIAFQCSVCKSLDEI